MDSNGIIWFFSDDYNALFKYSKGIIKYVTSFKEEGFFQHELYNYACMYNNVIFFFPVRAKKIACYDTNTNKVQYIDIPERSENIYYNIINKKYEEVYLFPVVYSQYAYLFNLKEKTFIEYYVPWDELKINKVNYLIGNVYNNYSLYFSVANTNKILKCCLEKKEYNVLEMNEETFRAHCFEKNVYFLDVTGNCILRLDEGKRCLCNVWKNENAGYRDTKNNMKFIDFIFITEEKIILLPNRYEYIKIIDKNNTFSFFIDNKLGQFYAEYFIKNNKIYLLPYRTEKVMIIDLITMEVNDYKFELTVQEFSKIIRETIMSNKNNILEEKYIPLNYFISAIGDETRDE